MTTPTIAIGIGQAGCRMLNELAEIVRRDGQEDHFAYIAIDTNSQDLHEESPDGVTLRPLEKPESLWDEDKERYSYLTPEFSLGISEGATRQRPIARYHVDSRENFEEVDTTLENAIDSFVGARQNAVDPEEMTADFNIWIMNALGGGTGSGLFPLLAAMVRNKTQRRNERFHIGGVGSLPRLDGLEGMYQRPAGRADFYGNSYAALRELRELVNIDKEQHWSSPPIKLESDQALDDELTWDGDLFDMYWLVGFSEKENSKPYRERMNRIAGNAVLYYAKKSSAEDFPDDESYEDERLYAISGAELAVPVEEAKEYVELAEEIDEAESRIDDLENEIDDHEDTVDFLDEIRSITLDPEEDFAAARLDHLDHDVIETCRTLQVNFTPHDELADVDILGGDVQRDEIEEILDTWEHRVLTDVEANLPAPDLVDVSDGEEEREYEKRDVAARLFFELLYKSLDNDIAGHDFEETVETVWTEWDEEIDEFTTEFSFLDERTPEEKWNGALKDFIREHGRALEEELDQLGILNFRKKQRLKDEIEELSQYHNDIPDYYERYKKLTALREMAYARYQSARQSLNDAEAHLQGDVIEAKRTEKEDLEREIRKRKRKRANRERSITTPHRRHGRFELALDDVSDLSAADLDEDGSIADLIDGGVLTRENVGNELSKLLENAALVEDPVQDTTEDTTVDTDHIFGVMAHHVNRDGPADDLLDHEIPGGRDTRAKIDDFDYEIPDRVDVADGFSIRLLSWFTPVALENTSEFGTVDEYYRSDELDIEEQLGEEMTDAELTRKFAYPELFPDDERIQKYYGF